MYSYIWAGWHLLLPIYSYIVVLIITYPYIPMFWYLYLPIALVFPMLLRLDDTLVAGWYLLLPKYSQKSKYIATLQSQYTRTLTFQNFSLAAPQRLDQNATGVLDVRLTAIDVIRRLALRGDRPVLGALITFKNSLSGTPQEERLYSAVVEVSCF